MPTTPLTRAQVSTLFSSALNTNFNTRGKKVQDLFRLYLKDDTPSTAVRIATRHAYFGEIAQKNDLAPTNRVNYTQGTTRQTNPKNFGAGIVVSATALDDLRKDGFGPITNSKIASMTTIGAKFRDSVSHTQELFGAQPVINGNSATATNKWIGAGYDTKALAATDHTFLANAGTWDNTESAATLSQAKIFNMRKTMVTTVSDEGLYRRPPQQMILVVGPDNEGNAKVALETPKATGGLYNDVSQIKDFNIDYIVSPFVTGTQYALFDVTGGLKTMEDGHGVFYCDFQKPVIEEDYDTNIRAYFWSVFFRFNLDFDHPYGFVRGSNS